MTGSPKRAKSQAAKQSTPRSGSARRRAGSATGTGKSGKFNANGRHVGKVWCASEAEAERYEQLLRLEMSGIITNLVPQPKFDLVVNNHRIAGYRADFRYDRIDDHGNVLFSVIEDIKGFVTPEFKLKRALFDALVTPALTVISPGQKGGSRARFMADHWDGIIPHGPGDFKTPPPEAIFHPPAMKD